MKYRIRYSLWLIEATTPEEAKRCAVHLMSENAERFISVEPAVQRPIWKLLLFGR